MPAGVVAGAGIVSNIVGGIAGREAGRADAGEARNAANLAFSELQKIGLPPDLSKEIIYRQFQQVGLLTPELEQHIAAGPSQIAQIEERPELQQAQMEALRILQQRGKTGLTPEDRAALNQIRGEIARDTEAKRQQILQNFAARGQSGSGAELIAALQASQGGSNAASEAGDRLAAMASQNALQSIGAAGTLGGQIRGQEFGQALEKAQAQEAIERFNIANQLGVQQRNVQARNIAQASNLGEAQRIADVNTQQANAEKLRQADAARQKWLDEVSRAQIRSGGEASRANTLSTLSQQSSQQSAAPFQTIGAGLTTLSGNLYKKWDGGKIPEYADGGKVKDESEMSKLFAAIRPIFGKKDETSNMESQEDKYAKIREQNRKNIGYNDGGYVQDYRDGGEVPGEAPISGDHPANDVVPAMLSPGEIVVPRSVAKTDFGKKLNKLLEIHHEVRKELDSKKQ